MTDNIWTVMLELYYYMSREFGKAQPGEFFIVEIS